MEDKEYTMNSVDEVYTQVLKDLDLADTCLVNTTIKNHPYRADITAVYLLKSRIYLYMQNWEKALEYAQKVMTKNKSLLDLNTLTTETGERVNQIITGNHLLHGRTFISLFPHHEIWRKPVGRLGSLTFLHDLGRFSGSF